MVVNKSSYCFNLLELWSSIVFLSFTSTIFRYWSDILDLETSMALPDKSGETSQTIMIRKVIWTVYHFQNTSLYPPGKWVRKMQSGLGAHLEAPAVLPARDCLVVQRRTVCVPVPLTQVWPCSLGNSVSFCTAVEASPKESGGSRPDHTSEKISIVSPPSWAHSNKTQRNKRPRRTEASMGANKPKLA